LPRAGAPGTPGSSGGSVGIVIAVVAVAAVVGVGGFVFLGGNGPGISLNEWLGKACPVDVNGDGTLDFVGRTGRPAAMQHQLSFIDGATGDTIRDFGSEYVHENQLLCLGPDRFAVTYPDFRLELWEASGAEPATTLRLPDAIRGWEREGDCLGLDIAGELHGVDLASGKLDACTAQGKPGRSVHGGPGHYDDPGPSLEHEGTTYRVTTKSQGTKFFIVQAEREGETVWEATLPIKQFDGTYLALSEDAVFTYGVKPGKDDTGVLVALEMSDGRVRFEQPLRERWSSHYAETFVYDGAHIVLTWGYGLHAYDAQTGERVWNLGGR
jgi:hypothetical protein